MKVILIWHSTEFSIFYSKRMQTVELMCAFIIFSVENMEWINYVHTSMTLTGQSQTFLLTLLRLSWTMLLRRWFFLCVLKHSQSSGFNLIISWIHYRKDSTTAPKPKPVEKTAKAKDQSKGKKKKIAPGGPTAMLLKAFRGKGKQEWLHH